MEASLRIDRRPCCPKAPRDDGPLMLVVEENELMRRLIAETLAHEAHVITAANGVEKSVTLTELVSAISTAASDRPELEHER